MPGIKLQRAADWAGLALLLTALSMSPARADVEAPTIPASPAGERLELVLGWVNGTAIDDPAEVFAPDFLAQVPPAQLENVRKQVFAGADTSLLRIDAIENDGDFLRTTIALDYEAKDTAYLTLLIGVDDDDQISTLLLQPGVGPASERAASWVELDAALDELPGVVAAGAYELTGDPSALRVEPIWERRGDLRLALGSSFKLWVLGAVGEAVARGELAWDDELSVRNDHKSLPSGEMQVHPEGTAFDLAHVATEMIRISDNTATDHLIRLVGRDACEVFMTKTGVEDERNTPFLTTKEMFQLKLGGDVDLRERFAQADDAEQRAMVADDGDVSAITPSIMLATAWTKPIQIDKIEWFASPRELALVMGHLRTMEHAKAGPELGKALRQNPGLAFDPSAWKTVGYKGGSEPGVLNMTWQLERDDGRWFCLTFGWNDTEAPVEMSDLISDIMAAATILAEWDRE